MSASLTIIWYLFGFTEFALFQAGEELLYGPMVSLMALIVAVLSWVKSEKQMFWHKSSLIYGIVISVMWLGTFGLFYAAYSDCPNGVC